MSRHTMPTTRLAELLGRLAIALSAGIDLRRAWTSETERTPSRWKPVMAEIRDKLAAGEPLSQAMSEAGQAFPPLVIGMTEVGEKTGHEPEIFREMARVLDRRIRTLRSLRASLAWPAFQLGIAVLVVGLLIFLAGVLRDAEGNPIDLLGFGLVGSTGVLIYVLALAAIGVAIWTGLGQALASWRSHGIVRQLLGRVPVLGAAARAWTQDDLSTWRHRWRRA
jgi:type II secretory pathway component PulF